MRLILIIFLFSNYAFSGDYLFSEKRFQSNKRWSKYSDSEKDNLKNLFRKLLKSKTGQILVKKAQDKAALSDKKILDIVKEGRGSLTDTTLIRKFSMGNPDHVNYESNSVVYINKELSQYDAVLDLAHELTHFVYRRSFNPYEVNFTLSEFIKNTIEGKGGEVQAFMMECKVQKELFPERSDNRYNCYKIKNIDGEFSFKQAVSRFYQVGNYFESFDSVLKRHGIRSEFPEVTRERASFVSSAYGIPYPVAAFEEYLAVINKVCENDKRRLGYFKSSKGRSPASITRFENSFKSKCKEFN